MMPFWIYLVLAAQFINAIVILVDKHLVTSPKIGKPVVYTFYIGALSGVVIFLLPFNLVLLPSLEVVRFSVLSGVGYVFSILFLYKSLKLADASDVAPVLGAVSAIATLVFSAAVLHMGLSSNFLYGFILLVVGTFLMSYFRLSRKAAGLVIVSGILFGLSSVFLKDLFNHTAFWNGFFWSRLANVFGVLLLLVWPANIKHIFTNIKESSLATKSAVVGNKVLGGLAFLLILYSIKLGNVSVVNALTGVQFAFLLLLAVIFTKKFPLHFYESVHHRHIIVQKVLATAMIIAGLAFLFV